jgi:hypothetical protein
MIKQNNHSFIFLDEFILFDLVYYLADGEKYK